MNKNLSEAIRKQRIRQSHRLAIKNALLVEQEHTLYSTFVQPFTDVVQAVGLTGQDILNALKLQFDLVFTLSPKKMEEAHQKFDARKAKIAEKWGPIMERTDEALANSDVNLFAMIMAPELFLATEALAGAYQAADSMGQYLADAGWKVPFASAILGYTPDGGGGGGGASGGDDQSLLSKITSLFGIESAWHKGPLIVEQQKPKKETDFRKAMKQYLKETGLAQQFEKDAKEMLAVQEEFVKTILEEAVPRLELIVALTQTADVDEFLGAIEDAQKKGLDLQAAGLDQVKQDVEDAAKKLIDSEDFRVQSAEQAKKSPEDISDQELEVIAKNVAFVNAKKEFDDQAMKGKEDLKAATLSELDRNMPDETNLNVMSKTPTGQAFIKLMNDAKQKIQSI